MRFDFSQNIEKDDLKYLTVKHRKIEVEVVYLNEKGQRTTKKFGQSGGVKETTVSKVADEKSAQGVAENIFARIAFDGYEGSFTSWLVPRVDPCFKVELRDAQREYENGVYFVVGTETNFSASGGARTVKLGRRL